MDLHCALVQIQILGTVALFLKGDEATRVRVSLWSY